jgi:ribonuclease P protein component
MVSSPEEYRSPRVRLAFSRTHHLKRKQLIEPLFDRSDRSTQSVAFGSVRVLYRLVEESVPETTYQIGVAVGRSAGSAVTRNRVKRVIRETVRLNQHLIPRTEQLLTAMVLFRGRFHQLNATPHDVAACLEKVGEKLRGISH